MKKISKKLLTALLAGAMLLTGCGGSKTQSNGETKSSSNDTFVYVAQQLVGTIDPAKALDETEIISVINLYDPLFYPDITNKSMSAVPYIAKGYEVDKTGKIYTIKINDGIKFQSGNTLTAADVAYSMERMVAIGEGNSWLWSSILDSVKATDDSTVVFTLKSPYGPFISSLTQLFIVDSKLLKANQKSGDFGDNGDYGQAYLTDHSAGSGPYILEKWDRQSSLDFKAFDGYWKGWKDGQVKKAQMLTVTEEATVKTLLISGQADMVHQWLSVSAYDELAKSKGITVQADSSAKLQYFPMNTQKAPTDDINVRKAIAYAFDYDTALNDILGGAAAAEGAVPVIVPGHSDNVKAIKQDIAKAKEYLAKSKYAGQKLTVSFMYLGDDAMQRQFLQLITANLKEIGITVDPKPVTWAQVTEAAAKPETTANLTVITDSLKYPHVDSHTFGIYSSSIKGTYRKMSWYENPEEDKVLDEARAETDVNKQMELYEKSQDIVTADFPAVYVANPIHKVAFKSSVKGYTFVGLMGYDIAFYDFTLE